MLNYSCKGKEPTIKKKLAAGPQAIKNYEEEGIMKNAKAIVSESIWAANKKAKKQAKINKVNVKAA